MREIIEHPNDKPLDEHPFYAFTLKSRIPVLVDALCAFYECEKADLKGKFGGGKYASHRYAHNHAWRKINGPFKYPVFGFNHNELKG